jgi:ABC-type phosphate/phosphonate transport system substrate-binding protein
MKRRILSLGLLVAANVIVAGVPAAQPKAADSLRVATSANLGEESKASSDTAGATLRSFIKTETGLDADIQAKMDYPKLADLLEKGQLDLGVMQGYEFAWISLQHPDLKALTIAVNERPTLNAYIVTRKDTKIKDLNDLKGKKLAIPNGAPFLDVYINGECQRLKSAPAIYFSKITHPVNAEDAVDDVVDKAVDAAVVERVFLEAYKQRKPGRFGALAETAHSPPFPPAVIVYKDGAIDAAKLKRFEDGLLNANKKQQGKEMLTFFKLTGFQKPPADFGKILADTAKAYPPAKEDVK